MRSSIKNFFGRDLIKNISSLALLQLMNYLFPLITIPYIVRILGVDKFGKVSFAFAFTAYFSLLVDFGFNYSATRSISINRNDPSKISQIISSVLISKVILFCLAVLIFSLLLYNVSFFANERELYVYSFVSVFGMLITPTWYFQGIEKMKVITKITFLARIISVLLVFILITKESDYKLYALINSGSSVIIGIISFFFIMHKIVTFKEFQITILVEEIKQSSLLFLSGVSINLYTVSNTFILGLFAPPIIVGYWAAADKIRIAVQNLLLPITHAIYPHLSNLFHKSIEQGFLFIKKSFFLIAACSFIFSLSLFVFAEPITKTILGINYFSSIYILKIISFLPFIIILSNLYGIQILLNLNGSKEFTLVVVFAAVFNVSLSLLIIPQLKAIGTALTIVATEIIVTLLMYYFAYRKLKTKGIINDV